MPHTNSPFVSFTCRPRLLSVACLHQIMALRESAEFVCAGGDPPPLERRGNRGDGSWLGWWEGACTHVHVQARTRTCTDTQLGGRKEGGEHKRWDMEIKNWKKKPQSNIRCCWNRMCGVKIKDSKSPKRLLEHDWYRNVWHWDDRECRKVTQQQIYLTVLNHLMHLIVWCSLYVEKSLMIDQPMSVHVIIPSVLQWKKIALKLV